jgi:anti-sigma regulatory factor (Ser/Thr protein kinase)
MAIAAHYSPGGADIGGDWYDAIELRGGGVGIAMGDVVGHGIEAASLMGELRNALRAYALEGGSPGEVLGRLDRLVEQLARGEMATLLYAVIEPDWSALRFATAGHPPPLLLQPGGEADYLWEGRSTPLGVGGSPGYEEATAPVPDGSTLVFYTDGLVEVRGETLTEGLDRLKEAVVSGPEDPQALCDHVIESLLDNRIESDDVAMLALRTSPLRPELLRFELAADRAALGYARRLLRRWLEQAGATSAEASDIQLASHEACANAIEHAHQFSDAAVEFEGRMVDSEVKLTVRDSGTWRGPPAPRRGRGMDLMKALMDGVSINRRSNGTEVELRRRLKLGVRTPQ